MDLLATETILQVAATFLLGGFIKGAIGMGLPQVVLTSLVMVMPLRDALAVFLVPGVVANIWQATSGPWFFVLVRRLWSYLLAAMIFIWIGVAVLAATRSDIMVLVLGVLLCSYSVWSMTQPRLPGPGRHEPWMSPVMGGLGGIMFGMTGTFIVPGLLYLETLGLKRDMFVQALGVTFITISSTLALSMTGQGLVSWDHAILSAAGLIPVGIGLWLGARVRKYISEAFYRRLFFIALFCIGVYLIGRVWLTGAI
ncbi:MAG: sulfite exporter TauE/SafE family protein [Pseudomonadota bacterium]